MTTTNSAIRQATNAMNHEYRGADGEAERAALVAGRLARSAGLDLDAFWAALPGIGRCDLTWNYIVDGWYGA